MFDVGFGELAVVSLVGLFVTKPSHLPVIAKVVGRYLGQWQQKWSYFKAQIKADIQDSNPHE